MEGFSKYRIAVFAQKKLDDMNQSGRFRMSQSDLKYRPRITCYGREILDHGVYK